MDKELTPFQSNVLEILENRRFWTLLAGGAFIVLAVGFGRYYGQQSSKKQERAASDKLYAVEKLEVAGIEPNPSIFTQDFMKKRLEWDAAKKEKIQKELASLIAEYPSTASAQSARIRLAAMAYQDTQYDQALKYFDDVVSNGTTALEDIPYWSAKLGRGYIFESQKKFDEALKAYTEVGANLKNPLAAEALLSQLRVSKLTAKNADMPALIEKIKTEFAGTYYESAARAYESAR
ncbi:MAG: tetratricopeptide repeat protein [Bdellovibrionota bacterium]